MCELEPLHVWVSVERVGEVDGLPDGVVAPLLTRATAPKQTVTLAAVAFLFKLNVRQKNKRARLPHDDKPARLPRFVFVPDHVGRAAPSPHVPQPPQLQLPLTNLSTEAGLAPSVDLGQ